MPNSAEWLVRRRYKQLGTRHQHSKANTEKVFCGGIHITHNLNSHAGRADRGPTERGPNSEQRSPNRQALRCLSSTLSDIHAPLSSHHQPKGSSCAAQRLRKWAQQHQILVADLQPKNDEGFASQVLGKFRVEETLFILVHKTPPRRRRAARYARLSSSTNLGAVGASGSRGRSTKAGLPPAPGRRRCRCPRWSCRRLSIAPRATWRRCRPPRPPRPQTIPRSRRT